MRRLLWDSALSSNGWAQWPEIDEHLVFSCHSSHGVSPSSSTSRPSLVSSLFGAVTFAEEILADRSNTHPRADRAEGIIWLVVLAAPLRGQQPDWSPRRCIHLPARITRSQKPAVMVRIYSSHALISRAGNYPHATSHLSSVAATEKWWKGAEIQRLWKIQCDTGIFLYTVMSLMFIFSKRHPAALKWIPSLCHMC